jgi:hypothetical protein
MKRLLGLFLFLCGLVAIPSPEYSDVLGVALILFGGWLTLSRRK